MRTSLTQWRYYGGLLTCTSAKIAVHRPCLALLGAITLIGRPATAAGTLVGLGACPEHMSPQAVPCCNLSTTGPASSFRPVPTPCRSNRTLPAWPQDASDHKSDGSKELLTLLEVSVREHRHDAFFETCILVETLYDHFGYPNHHSPAASGVQPPPATPTLGLPVCLDSAIPPTLFQSKVEELRTLVPCAIRDTVGLDWLDVDLRPLLHSAIPAKGWRQRFAQIQAWNPDAPQGFPTHLEIFTDGSADGLKCARPSGSPCAWAFAVWAVTETARYMVGWSAHAAVPTGTPFHGCCCCC